MRTLFPLLIASLAASASLFSQSPNPPQRVPQEGRQPLNPFAGAPQPAEPRFSVEFKGGPLVAYVQALKDAAPDINVVVDPEMPAADVPPVSLKSVTEMTALSLLEPLIHVEGGALSLVTIGRADPVYLLKYMRAQPAPMPPPQPRPIGLPAPQPPQPAPPSVEVMALSDVVGEGSNEKDLQTVLTAIDTALGLVEGEGISPPTIKVHQESGLLMVRGNARVIEVVHQVLNQIATSRRVATKGSANVPRLLPPRNEGAARIKQLEDEIEALKAEIAELKKARAAGK